MKLAKTMPAAVCEPTVQKLTVFLVDTCDQLQGMTSQSLRAFVFLPPVVSGMIWAPLWNAINDSVRAWPTLSHAF